MTDDGLYLIHIMECIERVERYTRGGESAFFDDTMVQDAVLRNLQVLAESTQRLTPEIKGSRPEVAWEEIAGFRNVLVHDYLGLRLVRVWRIVKDDLSIRRAWFHHHDGRFPVLVAETDGQVVGWCSLSPFHVRPAYRFTVEDSVYVRDAWRGRGIGRLLLRAILDRARSLGYHAVIARIGDAANTASVGLHSYLGFQHIGFEREVGFKFEAWRDVVVMEWLAPSS